MKPAMQSLRGRNIVSNLIGTSRKISKLPLQFSSLFETFNLAKVIVRRSTLMLALQSLALTVAAQIAPSRQVETLPFVSPIFADNSTVPEMGMKR